MKTRFEAIPVEGTHNFRDVGGVSTLDGTLIRTGRLFRSDGLHQVSDLGRQTLNEMGLRTSVDLRSLAERDDRPDALGPDIMLVEAPIIDDLDALGVPDTLDEVYRYMLTNCGDRLCAAVAAVAAPEALPAVVHCTAGKDRTGLVIALILSALGVTDAEVIDDYAATAQLLTPAFLDVLGVPQEVMVRSDPASMAQMLGWLDAEHGGARGYLLEHGLEPAALDRLADELLDPAGS